MSVSFYICAHVVVLKISIHLTFYVYASQITADNLLRDNLLEAMGEEGKSEEEAKSALLKILPVRDFDEEELDEQGWTVVMLVAVVLLLTTLVYFWIFLLLGLIATQYRMMLCG